MARFLKLSHFLLFNALKSVKKIANLSLLSYSFYEKYNYTRGPVFYFH